MSNNNNNNNTSTLNSYINSAAGAVQSGIASLTGNVGDKVHFLLASIPIHSRERSIS